MRCQLLLGAPTSTTTIQSYWLPGPLVIVTVTASPGSVVVVLNAMLGSLLGGSTTSSTVIGALVASTLPVPSSSNRTS